MILLCVAATGSSRTGAFGCAGEPLDEAGVRAAARCAVEARFRDHVVMSPARAAIETAAAMKVEARKAEALRDIDHGDWSGRSLEDVHRHAPEALAQWIANPAGGAPGGETAEAALSRVAQWLDGLTMTATPLLAITHPMVIRLALAHALDLPVAATRAIDIAPLARVRLSFNRIWRLQALEP